MKTATVTWLKYNNYGTFLQAYALQKIIEILECENKIIDDSSIYPKYIEKPVANRNLLYYLYKVIRYPFNQKNRAYYKQLRLIEEAKNKPFEQFKKEYLNIEYNLDYNYLNNEYDAFICGSDQIWGGRKDVFSPFYYLDFVTAKKKIAYAPSTGRNDIAADLKEEIKGLVEKLDFVSVREEKGRELLVPLVNKDIEVVLDPTVLLSRSNWDQLACNRLVQQPYLFCYFLGTKSWYREYARQLAKKMNLKLIILSSLECDKDDPNIIKENYGPREFISLIKYADFILTDSFHGTIFSLIYHKQFLTPKRFDDNEDRDQNSRIYNLFNKLELNNYFIDKELDVLKDIDYSKIDLKLEKEINKSLDYLKKALGVK